MQSEMLGNLLRRVTAARIRRHDRVVPLRVSTNVVFQ